MRALRFERSVPRLAAAKLTGLVAPGRSAAVGPLRLVEDAAPALPRPDWVRVRPILAGICGSDLATLDVSSSRWFEPIVSFPFVPGHEVVGETDDGRRVVLQAVLGCDARGITPRCPACERGETGRCRNIAFGHLHPGLQTGYCADTGGGWSTELVAHPAQLHDVPADLTDEDAVMVEPTACAVHAAARLPVADLSTVAVLGAGTIGLCTIAALRSLAGGAGLRIVAGAKHPHQRRLAAELGADVVVAPDQLVRAARRVAGTSAIGDGEIDRLTGGVDATVDCVGDAGSIATALAVTAPGGSIVLAGMPGHVSIDLTPLWQREIALLGAYTYGTELGGATTSFALAFDLVRSARLGRLVSATYPLDRYADAVRHAAEAGRRGAVKIAFDLRNEKRR